MSTFVDHVPDLELTPGSIARRKCWTTEQGYYEGEGVTLGDMRICAAGKPAMVFVWSHPGDFAFAFTAEDLLADDWYVTMRKP